MSSTPLPYRTVVQATPEAPPAAEAPSGGGSQYSETRSEMIAGEEGAAPAEEPALGPTPLLKVGTLNELIYGDRASEAKIKFAGWLDMDYTFRSTSSGINNIAPVENRFGNEFLVRELGLYIYKPLDPKCWSWGFNALFLTGSDGSFLTPTAGGWRNTDPRFGASFTDLNVTFHLPILTEGGIDIKAGRQTTVLGPMGAIAWQRYFDSSDYAWYNEEEGRYTGISADWHISKWLSWYNGIEFGWGTFYDEIGPAPQYITQINYWLDEDAKNTKVWTTVLTGPTGKFSTGNTTTTEIGIQHNWNKYIYQIIDSQICYSKAPIFFAVPHTYQERAYDVYTYLGAHLTSCVDVNSRFEWYKDTDGGGYPGGFGVPHTDYFELTLGIDYHPVKWVQLRPEIRYDHATHPNFGDQNDKKDQLSIATELLLKF
ncbi:MAG TPA: outer membrane beta-barrel protein [Gemmataceae bacterium]|nr:outer membrane beta-barrel protein [Gemmataceae bacterium]